VRISIITINLNNVNGLKKTIESVINQDYNNYEYLIIDGGSVDGSKDLIIEYASYISYWVSEPDSGIYYAMNKGLLKANGDYYYFLNSGDYFCTNNVLSKVFRAGCDADIIFGNLIVNENGKYAGRFTGSNHITFLDIYSSEIKHQATFIRRDLIRQYGLFDDSIKISADWEFFLRTLGNGNVSYFYVNTDIAFFENTGISVRNPEVCKEEEKVILKRSVPEMMREDYILLKKYKGIRSIERSKVSWFLFRILVKLTKLLA
jgi:glycosyltransferase involved in cell wall biosynthesis